MISKRDSILSLQELMFGLLSAILWLGNVQYQQRTADSVEVVPGPALSKAATLLRVPEDQLVFALAKRKIMAGEAPLQVYIPFAKSAMGQRLNLGTAASASTSEGISCLYQLDLCR